MSTRSLTLAAALAAVLASPAFGAPARPPLALELVHGAHLRIVSAYLRDGSARAVVRGSVRRAPLWKGPLTGHLDVTAYRADGLPAGQCATRWSGAFGRDAGRAAAYQCDLGAPRAGIVRLRVAYAPGVHQAGEAPR